MAKPDGRIEKGQRLSTAISARAWNRAQDAADIVLGVRPGVTAGPGRSASFGITSPVKLTSLPAVDYEYVGVPIRITDCVYDGSAEHPAGIRFLAGEIAEPVDLRDTTALPSPSMFAVTAEPMKLGETAVVQCIIKGLCIARVRVFFQTDRYVALPTRRSDAEQVADLLGTLETSAAGYGRFVSQINENFSLISI